MKFEFGFTDRSGGVSSSKYSSLNLAFHVGDEPQNVKQNRQILASNLGLNLNDLVFMNQVHKDEIAIINEAFMINYRQNLTPPVCDALVTNLKNIALCVMVADCSPVILIDEICGAVGVIHAGRAGVANKICTKTALKMGEIFGSKPQNLKAIVGPNIKGGCYEIGDMDLGAFNKFKRGKNFDMDAALKEELALLGVAELKFSAVCTHCDERYFSYRKEGTTGRFAGYALIKGKDGI